MTPDSSQASIELPTSQQLGIAPPSGKALATKTRGITNQRIRETIYSAKAPAQLPDALHWIKTDQLDSITLSGPHRRWVGELLQLGAQL